MSTQDRRDDEFCASPVKPRTPTVLNRVVKHITAAACWRAELSVSGSQTLKSRLTDDSESRRQSLSCDPERPISLHVGEHRL